MKKEIHLFLTALMFYTRISLPFEIPYSDDNLNKSTRYFPLIGWIVGGVSAISFWTFQMFLGNELAIIMALLVGVLVTGAFHEDGLADFFDGFGGGWTQSRILEIMKDSRVGTYGLYASIFSVAIKYFALNKLLTGTNFYTCLLIFITYHALARGTAIQLSFVLNYVREDLLSKAKPIAKENTIIEKVMVLFWAIVPLVLLSLNINFWIYIVILPLFFLVFYLKKYLKKWIGGYTGDTLGAAEQIAESVILVTWLGIWRYI